LEGDFVNGLLGEDKPLTDEEIDRDVEKSVEAINQAKVETLEAESLHEAPFQDWEPVRRRA
jgi:hypothetical protein